MKIGQKLKAKKLIAKRNRFYTRHGIAIPENVTAMQRAVERAVRKHGHRTYRKDRSRCDRFLKKLFKKYALRKTTSERFWYLWSICRLIGPSPEIRKASKVLEKTYVRPKEKSSKKFRKRKWKRR